MLSIRLPQGTKAVCDGSIKINSPRKPISYELSEALINGVTT